MAALPVLLAFVSASLAETTQKGNLRVSFEGSLAPSALPRSGVAPVSVTVGGRIKTTDASAPPPLRTIAIAINRNGRLSAKGLPGCKFHQIQPSTTVEAMRVCRRSLVGKGIFKAKVALPEQSPFPSNGTILAFNGNLRGRPVIYAHIYGTEPLPTSFVLPFEIRRTSGSYRIALVAELPRVAEEWGFVNYVRLTLDRSFRYRGGRRSYLSAGCPAPPGFSSATFNLARATFGFEDGRTLSSTLTRNCRVRR